MAIELIKTLQGKDYILYIVTNMRLEASTESAIEIHQKIYESKGHFDDGFVPIILKNVVVTNQQRVNTIKLLLGQNYDEAISVVENFLVNNVAYYQGGTVSNGEVI